jgi:exonuclease III
VVVGDINTLLSPIDKSTRQKSQQRNPELNDTTDLKEMTDVYRVFHHATTQYTFFSASHGTFSKTDHILGHKASLNEQEKAEIITCIIFDHNAVKLEINN